MKNKKWLSILLVFGTILVSYLGYSKKFVSIADSKLWPGSSSSNNKTFDHIDIQSVASFTYYVDGSPVNVNINFYDNREELGNVSVYRKNQDGTLTNIPVKGTWRSQTGTFNGIRTEKEYSISGKFDRYYENTTTEVVYLVQFKLNVTIAGKVEELVYSEEYSYNSSNNVCPGKTFGAGQGIDVLLSGNKLQEFFSASLKIVKNVVGAEDNTFTFRVKALNENIDFDKEVQITTNENTGSIILGGLVANESYSITEINIPEGYQIIGENPIVFTASQNNTITKTIVNSGKVVNISGTKTWEDNNDQDGIRPDSIVVRLYADGKEVADKTVTANDNWTYNFTNMPEYNGENKITYTVKEDTVKDYTTKVDRYNITNTHEVEKTNVKGTKTWEDNNDQDGIRPDFITVRLYADGVEVANKEVTKKDNWTYNFTNLDKFNNGKEIKYTVSEDAINGYTTTINGYDITNSHKVEKITIEGTKTWEDNNDQDGIRPDNIMVRLYADGKEVANKRVTKKDNWKYSFTNLDKNKDGKEIKYTVSEDAVDGYTTTINGFNITNSYEPEVININGVKTWDDNNNQDGIRPDSIVVRLYADDVEIEKKKVSAQDNWSYEFTNLDKKKNGKEIKYTISEDAIDGYTTTINGFNIVNTHTPETTKVMGKKIWNDNNNQDGIRPDSIVVRLYADGEYVAKADITSGVNNDWTYAFIDLPKYNNGKEIKYTVSEDAVDGYNTSYSEENEYIIINTHLIEKTSLNGVKTWDDNSNQDGIRPDSIMVRLYADGIEIANKKVTANDNWKYNFTDLDKYKDGQLVSYTITEDLVKGYSTVIDNNNITNTHEVEKINVSGTKTWDDNNNQDGIRPDFITVNLYGNNELLDSVVVNEESNWTYEFTNLDKYKDGYEIVYDVTEEIVDGYETTIEDFNITNTHIPEKITFKATKVWDDNNNQDGIRQSEIVVKLYKNDELFKEVTINEENNWTYSFVDLDRYENGIEIVYTVVEDVVLGYDTVIDYTEIDANNIISATITNTHIPEKTELNVRKIWLDRDNIMGLRPDNIEVDLYADGNFVKTVVISKDNNWNYLFDNLDKYQNGNLINYTFMEKPVYGYTTTYERSYIINTLDNYIYPENPEILPPQTGVKTKKNTFEYITLAIIGLFIFKQKNA